MYACTRIIMYVCTMISMRAFTRIIIIFVQYQYACLYKDHYVCLHRDHYVYTSLIYKRNKLSTAICLKRDAFYHCRCTCRRCCLLFLHLGSKFKQKGKISKQQKRQRKTINVNTIQIKLLEKQCKLNLQQQKSGKPFLVHNSTNNKSQNMPEIEKHIIAD